MDKCEHSKRLQEENAELKDRMDKLEEGLNIYKKQIHDLKFEIRQLRQRVDIADRDILKLKEYMYVMQDLVITQDKKYTQMASILTKHILTYPFIQKEEKDD